MATADGMPCRLCSTDSRLYGNRGDVALYRCRRCGFFSGQPGPGVSLEGRYHHTYSDALPPAPEGRYEEWLARTEATLGKGRMLEVGAGSGGFVRRWLGLRWRVIDPEHLGYFTLGTLRSALREAGFRTVRIQSRALDISTWRHASRKGPVARFDPKGSAELRDRVASSFWLRTARDTVNVLLRVTGAGDSLLCWAER